MTTKTRYTDYCLKDHFNVTINEVGRLVIVINTIEVVVRNAIRSNKYFFVIYKVARKEIISLSGHTYKFQ